MNEASLVDQITALSNAHPDRLNAVSAAILAALAHDLCDNSRSFARRFGIEHALVLRECTALAGDDPLIEVTDLSERTLRLTYRLTPRGESVTASLRS